MNEFKQKDERKERKEMINWAFVACNTNHPLRVNS